MTHNPEGEVETMAYVYLSCFSPDSYMLDMNFEWMSDEERQELAALTQEKIKEAFVEYYEDLYGGMS